MKTLQTTKKNRSRWAVAVAAVAITTSAALVPSWQAKHRQEKEAPRASTNDQSTSLTDQTDLAVTVYNSNIALVRDVRQLQLPSGEFRLKFMDIAATVNPVTVHFRSVNEPDKLSVVEQNYEYDLLDPAKLLNKYVGKEVTLTRTYVENNTTKHEDIKATLLANNNGPVWKIGNDIVTGFQEDSIRFPEVPGNLYDHPTLLMSLTNSGARKQTVEASYLAGNLSWNADYVLTVSRDDKTGDLDGWVTVVNNSGTAFHNAKLQLVAGDLNRLPEPMRAKAVMAMAAPMAGRDEKQFTQENFSEYHLYSLGRRTSVENNESKQISLLEGTGIAIEKLFVVNGQNFYYRNAQNPGQPIKDAVQVFYKFKNDTKSSLGVPLPAGNIRVYQKDSKGGLLFIGEDHIDHTPKDETVTVKIGNAFDIVSERKQTDFKKVADHVYEMAYEIVIRNHKDTPVTVEVNEPIGGDWEMLSSSFDAKKTAAFAAQFMVPVKANGDATLTYRVRVKW
jgi:hypothetical protein